MKTRQAKNPLLTKKKVRQAAMDKIESGFTELKSDFSEKQFYKRVKKAAKILTAGLPKKSGKDKSLEKVITGAIEN